MEYFGFIFFVTFYKIFEPQHHKKWYCLEMHLKLFGVIFQISYVTREEIFF